VNVNVNVVVVVFADGVEVVLYHIPCDGQCQID
jgi:hypothetical protein